MPHGKQNKKNASGAGTIRKKTVTRNGKDYVYWEARYTVGFDTGTGKQKQKSITGKTQKEVAQKLRQVTVDIDAILVLFINQNVNGYTGSTAGVQSIGQMAV